MTAFVLAGGKSSRMGSDKAFLELAGRSLLNRALDLARAVVPDVRIVGDAGKFAAFAPTVSDIYPARGPLGGIHAALTNSTTESNLISVSADEYWRRDDRWIMTCHPGQGLSQVGAEIDRVDRRNERQ